MTKIYLADMVKSRTIIKFNNRQNRSCNRKNRFYVQLSSQRPPASVGVKLPFYRMKHILQHEQEAQQVILTRDYYLSLRIKVHRLVEHVLKIFSRTL